MHIIVINQLFVVELNATVIFFCKGSAAKIKREDRDERFRIWLKSVIFYKSSWAVITVIPQNLPLIVFAGREEEQLSKQEEVFCICSRF